MPHTPLLWLALSPKTEADREKLARGVTALMADDPTMRADTDPVTGEVVIGGMGELHLEIIVDRLIREFHVEASVNGLRVAYKETFTRQADGEGRYVRHGQYGHVKIHVYPGDSGSGYVFENGITGGAIPGEFIKSIDEGIRQALADGVLADNPVDDVRIVLYDGSYHDIDSSNETFRIAGIRALYDAARMANPVLLEPVMRVEVLSPMECVRDVVGNLSKRRGRIVSQEDCDGMQRITVRVPLSEMLGYGTDLRSRTRGRGTWAMQLASYQPFYPAENQGPASHSMAGVPRRSGPTPRDPGVALPEPEDGLPS